VHQPRAVDDDLQTIEPRDRLRQRVADLLLDGDVGLDDDRGPTALGGLRLKYCTPCLTEKKIPLRLTPISRSQSASSYSCNSLTSTTPAQLTMMFSPPNASTVVAKESRTWASTETSAWMTSDAPPCSAVISPRSARISTRATFAPSSTKSRAVAAPIPDDAPLIQAVLPVSLPSMTSAP